jgi:hypothetical protein
LEKKCKNKTKTGFYRLNRITVVGRKAKTNKQTNKQTPF